MVGVLEKNKIMIRLPQTIEQALVHAASHDVRAGGTDLQERRSSDSTGELRPVLDLRDVAGLDRIERSGDGLRIGVRVPLAKLARDPWVSVHYPALTQAAGALGTPQIREVASLGGNLLQAVRCPYFRDPAVRCLRSGGAECWARQGDHLWHVCFTSGPCVAPHASTLGMVLLALDARLRVAGG
ncbi:MAG TPA: oxidoreductase, partial [Nannocystis exedens]|nr:oxidoreductase [Nannocystis exedens]